MEGAKLVTITKLDHMKNIWILAAFLIVSMLSCEKETHKPLYKGEKPMAVSGYTVENLSGAAKITCKISDENTLYVKAVYTIKNGVKREAKASKFDNILVLDGFPESKEYIVSVYAVSVDEKESEPIAVTVHPLTPPFKMVKNNLEFNPTYGGGLVSGSNDSKANLMIGVITKNSAGEWIDVTEYFSSAKEILFSFRGFEPKPREFGIYVRDQWQNYSDTLFKTITPWEEVKVNMSNFQQTVLPGDAPARAANQLRKMFDGVTGSWVNGYYSENVGVPQHITIDLGKTFQLSRFRLWQNSNLYYQSANAKHMRIWGSMNPNPNGELDDTWYLLEEFDDWKPSGLPPGQMSDEDVARAEEGNEFLFDVDTQPARYIRIETLSTYQPRTSVYFVELAFWGREI